jgi:U3 small nucleolar RNA-associated protein 14
LYGQHTIPEKKRRKKKKEKRKKKAILDQTSPNHNTHVIQGGRGRRDESNDVVEAPLQPSVSAARDDV